ncbi:electron transport complex subunit RsxC [Granulosicoccaceae sp. 1_MG-2023]|nr:electron transport complex subunit RsxC [Granulosicoccaceae sp. 1_MG-2023]
MISRLFNTRDTHFRFNGGIHLDDHKAESTGQPSAELSLSGQYTLPLRQHIGAPAQALVSVGDNVLKGQLIARPGAAPSAALHAPTSGRIVAIDARPVPHPSGLSDQCIVLEADGEDRATDYSPVGEDWPSRSREELLAALQDSGIVGLGGAVFPTATKLGSAREWEVTTLIINGAECEPWITCDQTLMQENAAEIVRGIGIALHLSGATECLVGIEDNKPAAISAMSKAAKASSYPITVVSVPTLYPTGGERQLIKVLTDKEVPAGKLPSNIGMLVMNVGTVYALERFISTGEPLITRMVTVTGDGVRAPQNFRARIGTPLADLIQAAGGYTASANRLTLGGPMMGYALPDDTLPLVKAGNCLLVTSPAVLPEKPAALPCIRCGACAQACPAGLLPQQLYWYSRARNHEALEKFAINSCIECGCCDYVCPSHIPLVHYFRFSKTDIRSAAEESRKADIARQRHDARQARLDRIAAEKAAKLAAKKAALAKKNAAAGDDKKDAIAQALERAKARKAELNKDDKQAGSSAETGGN